MDDRLLKLIALALLLPLGWTDDFSTDRERWCVMEPSAKLPETERAAHSHKAEPFLTSLSALGEPSISTWKPAVSPAHRSPRVPDCRRATSPAGGGTWTPRRHPEEDPISLHFRPPMCGVSANQPGSVEIIVNGLVRGVDYRVAVEVKSGPVVVFGDESELPS